MIVFSKKWFEKYQQRFLWLLNSRLTKRLFRRILRIDKTDIPLSVRITHLSTSNYSYIENGQNKICFYTYDKFSRKLYRKFKPFWYLLHFWDWALLDRIKLLDSWSFGFSTLTVYPDAGSGATSVDGDTDRKSTRLNSSHTDISRMPSSA